MNAASSVEDYAEWKADREKILLWIYGLRIYVLYTTLNVSMPSPVLCR